LAGEDSLVGEDHALLGSLVGRGDGNGWVSDTVGGGSSRVGRWGGRGTLVPGAGTVNTHRKIVIALAILVSTSVVVGGDVPVAAHLVVDVVAELGSITTDAGTNAELRVGDELGPLVVLHTRAEGVSVNETTSRITAAVSTTVIELTSSIALLDVQLGEIANTSDLNVARSLDEVNTLECAVGDGTSTTAGLGAPSDSLVLRVADGAVGVRRCPEAEVLGRVHPCGLAVGSLAGGGSAGVGSVLAALGGGRKLGGEVTDIPDLVGVGCAIAGPDLRTIARSSASLSKVEALAVVDPGDRVIPDGIGPFLVGVGGVARPDLKFSAVSVDSIDNVEAFVSVDLDGTVGKGPFLVGVTSAGLDGNNSAVSVRGRSQALIGSQCGLDQESTSERRCLARDCADSCSDEDNGGGGAYHGKGM